jgi:glycosyltransferase involved in cell wall biosynthesis
MRVVLAAPNIDGTDVGEAFVAFKWAEALAREVDLTVLSFERPGRVPLRDQLPGAQVVTWVEPPWARLHERFNAMVKPAYPIFFRNVRRWMNGTGAKRFDLAHQIMPQAARYPSPFRGLGLPFVIGPLGGALDAPEAFRSECGTAPGFTRLRALDALRFRRDPWLRASYGEAAAVLGVAPYVRDVLAATPIKRFETVLELGVDDLAPEVERRPTEGSLRLLHVGRGVRTKGLRDVVRALKHLIDMPGVSLTSAGLGEEIGICREEAQRLGVADRVTFLGRVARDEVEDLYRTHDVFAFPSFREPAGGVLYEAMRWGLPVITAARGGPDWIIDDACGVRLPISTPEALSRDIATTVRSLAGAPEQRVRFGAGGRAKLLREGLWPVKAARLAALFRSLIREPMAF